MRAVDGRGLTVTTDAGEWPEGILPVSEGARLRQRPDCRLWPPGARRSDSLRVGPPRLGVLRYGCPEATPPQPQLCSEGKHGPGSARSRTPRAQCGHAEQTSTEDSGVKQGITAQNQK